MELLGDILIVLLTASLVFLWLEVRDLKDKHEEG